MNSKKNKFKEYGITELYDLIVKSIKVISINKIESLSKKWIISDEFDKNSKNIEFTDFYSAVMTIYIFIGERSDFKLKVKCIDEKEQYNIISFSRTENSAISVRRTHTK